MLVYEVFTEKLPYKDFGSDIKQLISKIMDEELRPDTSQFPHPFSRFSFFSFFVFRFSFFVFVFVDITRHDISFLMQECWLPDPAARPNCDYIVVRLGQMLSSLIDSHEEFSRISRMAKIAPRKYDGEHEEEE
jgi:hypothetical protein